MTEKVGIIGYPLTYSLSPAMHNAAFQALGLDWEYELMPIPPDILRLGLREPAQHGYIGLNVTIPHKQAVMQFVRADELARAIGAVNTIDLRTNVGTNTDMSGLIDDLNAHGIALNGAKVVVLGAGGAARAAVYGLGQSGAQITVVNRTLETARTMIANLMIYNRNLNADVMTLDEAAEHPIDLIINCTSVGMSPNVDESPWIEGVPFPYGVTVYDMVYRPAQTRLMTQAEMYGGRAIGGVGMLVRQGAAAFQLWTGIDAPIDVMFDAVRSQLAKG
ncbi:MAG: shikimate dehydrogenase [Anaerolineae bacterium]|jgi:shikimate dehydrogenase|nr:shikimate dehydrogenase [Anaerolineae bacterium]